MQRMCTCLLVSLSLAGGRAVGQQVNTPADSLPVVLCHAWIAGNKIVTFVNDHTLTVLNTKNNDKGLGQWSFDPVKKQIQLVVNGRKDGTIISLSANTLTMQVDTQQTTSDGPAALKVVYQRRQL